MMRATDPLRERNEPALTLSFNTTKPAPKQRALANKGPFVPSPVLNGMAGVAMVLPPLLETPRQLLPHSVAAYVAWMNSPHDSPQSSSESAKTTGYTSRHHDL